MIAMLSIGAGAQAQVIAFIEQLGVRNLIVEAREATDDQTFQRVRKLSAGMRAERVTAVHLGVTNALGLVELRVGGDGGRSQDDRDYHRRVLGRFKNRAAVWADDLDVGIGGGLVASGGRVGGEEIALAEGGSGRVDGDGLGARSSGG